MRLSGHIAGFVLASAACTGAPNGQADDDEITFEVDGTDRRNGGVGGGPGTDACGDVRISPLVYNGTSVPSYVPLADGQALAIGLLTVGGGVCSGTLIAPQWVLTAKHCTEGVPVIGTQFATGTNPNDPSERIPAHQFFPHPDADLSLIELAQDATEIIPGILPVRILGEAIDESWIGRTAEAAGYGETETGEVGARRFTAEPISALRGNLVEINGEGRHGVCFGDSGGPLMVVGNDGSNRVAGALSGGQSSCTGRDNFTRVDLFQIWIEEHTGPTPSTDSAGCGRVGREGRCVSPMAIWCEDEVLHADACAQGTACAWNDAAFGYRCVEAERDPCNGLNAGGTCDENVARWCDRGEPRTRDCGMCGETCQFVADMDGFYCAPDPCVGVSHEGRCNGNVAEWCEDGVKKTRDCASVGGTCGWIDETTGYYCR